MQKLVLASNSATREKLLSNAGLEFEKTSAKIDEETIKNSLLAEGASPTEIAIELAHAKAAKVSSKLPEKLVLGCDQTLEFEGSLISKSNTNDDAVSLLCAMSGKNHYLHSAAVIYLGGSYQWHHLGSVELTMHELDHEFIAGYVERNWESIQHCVGCYMLEAEGIQLFSDIKGSYFDVLGLPMIEVLSYLRIRKALSQ